MEKNGTSVLDLFEASWDKRAPAVKHHSPLPVIRAYLITAPGLRREVFDTLRDIEGEAGATWATQSRSVMVLRKYDRDEGQKALGFYSDKAIWRGIDKVFKERTQKGLLSRGKLNLDLLTGPSATT